MRLQRQRMPPEGDGGGVVSYARDDATESVAICGLKRADIAVCLAGWGAGNEDEPGNGGTDWTGGFLFKLRDGRFAYVTGGNDCTGWGCQDEAYLVIYPRAQPSLDDCVDATRAFMYLSDDTIPVWDVHPADINRWIETGEGDEP